MYSPEFMRFLVGRDANEHINNEKEEQKPSNDNIMYRYSRYATIPIEIKK